MKRIATIVLLALIGLVLCGCGGSNFGLTKTETFENVSWRVNPTWTVDATGSDRFYISGGSHSGIYAEFDFSQSTKNETPDQYIKSIKSMHDKEPQQTIENWQSESLGSLSGSNFTGEVYRYSFDFIGTNDSSETYLAFIKSGSTSFLFAANQEPLFKAMLSTIKIENR